jgi:hypothetical protein
VYLRVNVVDPPRQVYWDNATPRQHKYLAELFGAGYSESEGRAFKSSWLKARAAVDAGTPPVLGSLDMFHLHWYVGLYHQRHIPIHFLLLVDYDDGRAYVQDTSQKQVQTIPLEELRLAWDVNAPGLGKRNRLAVLDIPQELPSTETLIRQAIADQCRTMLQPPASMLGVPALKKVAREIARWLTELGEEAAARCLRQVRNSPPDLEGNHLTAGRDLYLTFLQEAGPMAGLDFTAAIHWLGESLAIIPELAEAIRCNELEQAAAALARVAEAQAAVFTELSRMVGITSQ